MNNDFSNKGNLRKSPSLRAERSKGDLEVAYDVAIIGGGLAGLALSIQLVLRGYSVILFEKEKYPFHKVCGEYISFESWDFLKGLGLPLDEWHLPLIKNFIASSPKGKLIKHALPLGGFGISRYKIDAALANIAKQSGVEMNEESKITDVYFENETFTIPSSNKTIYSKIVAGCFGKRSNLDVKWNRHFITEGKKKLNNYVGVKYHVQTNFPANTIALHNFKNGYCGISQIEDNKFCLCYLTTAAVFKQNNNSIKEVEQNVLYKNPHLKKIFTESQWLYDAPLTISQISFDKKSQVENHVLMIGDAAGMITPLCGNGMSMALHASKISDNLIHQFLQNKITRNEMEKMYFKQWDKHFSRRLRIGRIVQSLFGRNRLTHLFISCIKPFPWFINFLIRQTHGKPF